MTAQIALMILLYVAFLAVVGLAAYAVLARALYPCPEVVAARAARRAAKVEAYNLARLIETYR